MLRIYEIAKKLNTTSKRILELFGQNGIQFKSHMSLVPDSDYNKLIAHMGLEIDHQDKIISKPQKDIPLSNPNRIDKFYREASQTKLVSWIEGEEVDRKLQYVYSSIEDSRKRYGDYKKCEFHLHTPASKCYKLLSNWTAEKFNNLTLIELLEVAEKNGLYNNDMINVIKHNIEYYEGKRYKNDNKSKPFVSFFENTVFKLITHSLYKNNIDVAVVSDHHTIEGYIKLKVALEEYYKERRSEIKKPIFLLMGVEISCSDDNHVVGIFNDTDENIELVVRFLKDISYPGSDGTFYPSQYIIEEIISMGGIAYLAHLNSSNFNGNEAYKVKLMNIDNMIAIGLTDMDKKDAVYERIKPFIRSKNREFCFLNESDAHSIEQIGKRNTWVKFSNKISFPSLLKAIEDYGVCIKTDVPNISNKYIKGMVICPGEYGYLGPRPLSNRRVYYQDKNDLVVEFSQDLNCIIGGRGTGKSTLLNIINISFNLEADNDILEFICKNEQIFILFYFEGTDYILRFIPQIYGFYYNGDIKYSSNAFKTGYYKTDNEMRQLTNEWIQLYAVNDSSEKNKKIIRKTNNYRILNDFFRRGYSINNLVSKISNNTIGTFIRDVVMNGIDYADTKQYIKEIDKVNGRDIISYIKKNMLQIVDAFNKQKNTVDSIIQGFNEKFDKQLRIIYSPRQNRIDYVSGILDKIARQSDKHIAGTFLTWQDIEHYVKLVSQKIGFIQFIYLLFIRNYEELEKVQSLKELVDYSAISITKISTGLSDVNRNNTNTVFSAIFNKLREEPSLINECLMRWLKEADDFTIEFNINYKESVETVPTVFKPLNELSLGQKVSALLTFVFNYGEYAGDTTPLIIDQPEDNLDNQYIYKNLIKSLRNIKNKRQVIVVTHNSTIVTNADAEQVIVMGSDNKKGWIQSRGYPSDETIVRHIVNHMEGGVESLRNKILKYRHFIKELNINGVTVK